MSGVNLSGRTVLSATINEPRIGAWVADVVVDDDEDLSGTATITFEDATNAAVFTGTVVRSQVDGGRLSVRIVGGAGGMSKALDARHYKDSTSGKVLSDIAEATGESLDAGIISSVTGKNLNAWMRPMGSAGQAVSDLVGELGVSWRILRTGKLWVGAEKWPKLEFDHTELTRGRSAGFVSVAPTDTPLARPGVTFLGKRVTYVVTTVEGGTVRQQVWFEDEQTGDTDRLKDVITRIVETIIGRRVDLAQSWPAKVVRQSTDKKTVDIIPDDPRMGGGQGGAGLKGVPIRHGLPGYTVEVAHGARCQLHFENGDPMLPYVSDWEPGSVLSVSFDGGTRPVARVGDPVQVFFPVEPMAITGTLLPSTPFTGFLTIVTPGNGIIAGGNPKDLG